MNVFKQFHPIVNFVYFVFVIGFSCFFMHPVCLLISLLSALTYYAMLKGIKAMGTNLLYMLPVILAMAVINPIFSHQGITIIGYFPNGNPLTMESIVYGIAAAVMIAGVICWFWSYNQVMTGDKFIYLFGRIIPSLSLILSMTFRLIPEFSAQFKIVRNSQKCLGRDASKGSIIKRAKYGLSILSIMATWALENSIETADSMKSRGYGIPGRTAFSVFKFEKRDIVAVIFILILGLCTFIAYIMGGMHFEYFPAIKIPGRSLRSIGFLSYAILCWWPVLIEIKEERKWNALKSKI